MSKPEYVILLVDRRRSRHKVLAGRWDRPVGSDADVVKGLRVSPSLRPALPFPTRKKAEAFARNLCGGVIAWRPDELRPHVYTCVAVTRSEAETRVRPRREPAFTQGDLF